MEKVFSKQKWLEAAQAEVNSKKSSLTQEALNFALDTWVSEYDGKTAKEIGETQSLSLERYFI